MGSDGTTYVTISKKVGMGTQIKFRLKLDDLGGCSVGITDGKDL
jgi:hypothetical protein